MNNYYLYQVYDYSSEHVLEKIKQHKIKINSFKKESEYLFFVEVNIFFNNKFLKCFPQAKLIKKHGLFFIIKNRLIKKTTIISLIISVIFYIFLSTLIYKIDIKGNNQRITNNIIEVLKNNNIEKYKKIPSTSLLEEVKKEIITKNEEIEKLDYKVQGTVIKITYYLKEKEIQRYQELGKYYAAKDGMIRYADIECGNYLFSTNQYVKKGELLIDDYLYINDKSIYVGGYGKVYANTWSIVNLKIKTNSLNEVDAYTYLLDKARYGLTKSFTDDEKIEKENILSYVYNKNECSIKIHYTLLENIAILQNN